MLKDSIDTIDRLTVICFSPTCTSRKIAEAVAAGMTGMSGGTAGYADASRQMRTIDLTIDRSDEPIILNSGWAVVLGAPVYAGRVAPEAVRRLRRIQVAAGASVPAVVTVTYGNRDYEDALVAVPTHWTWPTPVSSADNAHGNWTVPEHLPHFTSKATGHTKSRPARPQTHPVLHSHHPAARPNQLRLSR